MSIDAGFDRFDARGDEKFVSFKISAIVQSRLVELTRDNTLLRSFSESGGTYDHAVYRDKEGYHHPFIPAPLVREALELYSCPTRPEPKVREETFIAIGSLMSRHLEGIPNP